MAGTPVVVGHGHVAIEELQVGDRVSTSAGGFDTQVDATWQTVDVQMAHPELPNHVLDLTLLRPRAWLAAVGADEVGGEFYLELEELGASGVATVMQIRGPPEVADGPGRVVLSTITHVSGDVFELRFEDSEQVLRPTAPHRFFSLDRQDWVPTEELEVGETIQALGGGLVVLSAERLADAARVYNIEVEGEHEYLVGLAGVRTHNICPGGPTADQAFARIDRIRERVRGLNPLGDAVPVRRDGNGTVALVVRQNGSTSAGLNSTLLSDRSKNLARNAFGEMQSAGLFSAGSRTGQGASQVLFHAETNALLRASSTGGLGRNVRLFVDRATCANCATQLPLVLRHIGVDTLDIIQKNGITRRFGQLGEIFD